MSTKTFCDNHPKRLAVASIEYRSHKVPRPIFYINMPLIKTDLCKKCAKKVFGKLEPRISNEILGTVKVTEDDKGVKAEGVFK